MIEWYYSNGSQSIGPLQVTALIALREQGRIGPATLVWRDGMTEWRRAAEVPELFPPPAPPTSDPLSMVSGKINQVTSTERVTVDHVRGLFSAVFRAHSANDLERVFSAGVHLQRLDVSAGFDQPSPWVYSRLLVFFGVAFVGLWFGWSTFENIKVLPGVLLIGSFAFPSAAAIFFFECNAPRNISLITICRLFVWGGVLSILLSLVLFQVTGPAADMILGASVAAIVEEPGKLAAVLILTRAIAYPWAINGICLGAAVGAGFAAFESAGYALEVLLTSGGGVSEMLDNLVMRGLLAPFAHVVWTAIAAGAVWRVKRGRPFEFGMLWDPRCLVPLVACVLLHGLWNSSLPARFPSLLGYLLLGVIAWIILIGMLVGALRELREGAGGA